MTLSTSDIPSLVEKNPRKVWIKDGQRRISTDSGYMNIGAKFARKMFGNYKQGRYSKSQ